MNKDTISGADCKLFFDLVCAVVVLITHTGHGDRLREEATNPIRSVVIFLDMRRGIVAGKLHA